MFFLSTKCTWFIRILANCNNNGWRIANVLKLIFIASYVGRYFSCIFPTPTLFFSSDIQNSYCLDPPSHFQMAFKHSCNDVLWVDDENDISEVTAIQIWISITMNNAKHVVEFTPHFCWWSELMVVVVVVVVSNWEGMDTTKKVYKKLLLGHFHADLVWQVI